MFLPSDTVGVRSAVMIPILRYEKRKNMFFNPISAKIIKNPLIFLVLSEPSKMALPCHHLFA
jgi:hypothetical protein